MNIPIHGKYEWIPILYDFVKTLRPEKILEFGPGKGYTSITMAKALQENNIDGHIYSYDMWDDEYWGSKQETQSNYDDWKVNSYITLSENNFFDWIKNVEDFDFMYFDIDNTGEKIELLYDSVRNQIKDGSVIFFEGGSVERDRHGHLGQFPHLKKMNDVKDKVGYKVLTDNVKYSASAIYNSDMYNLDLS